jgi:hypothetical protein
MKSPRFLVVLIAILVSLTSALRIQRNVMSMNIWNAQKVGQSVVDTSSLSPSGTETASVKTFKKVLVGAGSDERPLYGSSYQEEEEANHQMLSKIDKSLRQKSLLQGLSSGRWSMVEQVERIRLASAYENLLPSSFSSQVVSTPNLKSGGLLNEWDF